MKKRFSEEQIIGFLREADAGMPAKDLCRRHGFSDASYDLWRGKFGGMNVSDARRLKTLEAENTRLKKLLAETMLEQEVTREVLRGGAEDVRYGSLGTPFPAGDGHERQRPARSVGPGSPCVLAGGDPGDCSPPPSLRGRHDVPEAPPTGHGGQPQTCRAALYRSGFASTPTDTQAGTDECSSAADTSRRRERRRVQWTSYSTAAPMGG